MRLGDPVLNGQTWEIPCECFRCKKPFTLHSTEEPTPMAMGFAAIAVCTECESSIEEEREAEERALAIAGRIRDSKLPVDLRDLTFSTMIEKGERGVVIAAAKEWAAARGSKGLLIHGKPGVGKTRLAGTAAWERLQRLPVRYVSVAILIAQIGASFSDKGRGEALSVLTGSGAIVLDDLDKVNPSEWIRGQLFTAIDSRVQAGAALLVTTNLHPVQLRERYGEAITSRLVGYCETHELKGPDYRLELDGTKL